MAFLKAPLSSIFDEICEKSVGKNLAFDLEMIFGPAFALRTATASLAAISLMSDLGQLV